MMMMMTLVSHYRDSFTEGKVQRISIRRSMTFDKVFFSLLASMSEVKGKIKIFYFLKKKVKFDQTANTNISVDRFLQHFFLFSNPKM